MILNHLFAASVENRKCFWTLDLVNKCGTPTPWIPQMWFEYSIGKNLQGGSDDGNKSKPLNKF